LERSDELTLDLIELMFIDSSGIRAILALAECAKGSLVLRHPSDAVRKIIDLTGIVGRNGIVLDN
jgi:anti-anti-sigma factor